MSSAELSKPGLEAVFEAHYERVARVVAKVIRDPARAEELAVDVFLKWSSTHPKPLDEFTEAWLCRCAARLGLDELRRRTVRNRFESLISWVASSPTPEDLLDSNQEQDRIRQVLCSLEPRSAEILLLRGEGWSYAQLAGAIGVNASSAGTLLARAQKAFRKEYVKRYGDR